MTTGEERVATVAPPADGTAATAPMPVRTRLLWTAGMVTVISAAGSMLGLVRDVLIARYFGASAETDAFLVAWTIPETASPLLLDGAIAYLLVPRLAAELERRGTMQRIADSTFLPAMLAFAALTGITMLGAPALVSVLAPGLIETELAVRCVRAAALTIFFLGVAGYQMAALRASSQFFVPAWVSVVYNVGIISAIASLHHQLGVYSAALGLAIGSAGMVVLQAGPFLRRIHVRQLRLRWDPRLIGGLWAFLPIAVFTLGRQTQAFVERFFGSSLGEGVISQLNYATKVAQVPLLLATTVAMVSMPSLARHTAAGRTTELRAGVEGIIGIGVLVIAPAAAAVIAFAPELITLLFHRGVFTTADVADTARIMRFYAPGLIGQTVVAVLAICYWSQGRRTWYPAGATAVGLLTTLGVAAVATGPLGAAGIALANAVGITVCAAVLFAGLGRHVVPVGAGRLVGVVLRAVAAATVAGFVGMQLAQWLDGRLPMLLAVGIAGIVLVLVYGAATALLGLWDSRAGLAALRARVGRPRRS